MTSTIVGPSIQTGLLSHSRRASRASLPGTCWAQLCADFCHLIDSLNVCWWCFSSRVCQMVCSGCCFGSITVCRMSYRQASTHPGLNSSEFLCPGASNDDTTAPAVQKTAIQLCDTHREHGSRLLLYTTISALLGADYVSCAGMSQSVCFTTS